MVDRTLRVAAWITEKTNPPVESVPPGKARLQMRRLTRTLGPWLFGRPPADVSAEDRTLAGVATRIYRPAAVPQPAPALVYFHGGGWVVGDLDSHDGVCRALARAAGRVVIAVDYRLAPEHAFPAAYDDAWAVTQAVHAQAAELGLQSTALAVAGDSAGGNLAAVVALQARETGLPLSAQLLIYPVLDCVDESPSYATFATGHFLTREAMRYYIRSYLPRVEDRRLPRASPLHAGSLAGVAPALVVTAEADVLRDEGLAYVEKLRASGVAVQHIDAPGMLHGFFNLQSLRTPKQVMADCAAWLQLLSTNQRAE